MSLYAVTSEIFNENENLCVQFKSGRAISKFEFKCPSYMIKSKYADNVVLYDSDDDLDIDRDKEGIILLEHRVSTELKLVGLQVWRGALLLADYIMSHSNLFKNEVVLELGSGVGLTSIVAGFLAKEVICTDVNLGNMLKLIERNFMRNSHYIKSKFSVEELDFLNLEWNTFLEEKLDNITVVLAADVIYDEKITEGFVRTLAKLLNSKTPKVVYVALEKRFVFTIADMDTTAPMYEEFLNCIQKQKLNWSIEYIKINFPKYFKYDRVKHMILMKIKNNLDTYMSN